MAIRMFLSCYSTPTVKPMSALMPETGLRAMWFPALRQHGSLWAISWKDIEPLSAISGRNGRFQKLARSISWLHRMN